ncbi:MAG TPA: hypothetical protein IAC62_15470 [Candidatus Pelethocola excrementipullorum]|nr:hypothetical protein [Candidatus Pelethocola excrementipullorum]
MTKAINPIEKACKPDGLRAFLDTLTDDAKQPMNGKTPKPPVIADEKFLRLLVFPLILAIFDKY